MQGQPNGLRYPRVGGVWIRSEGSINPKPEKSLKMPQNPTRRVHALLGGFLIFTYPCFINQLGITSI
jgi:hypothetical protein